MKNNYWKEIQNLKSKVWPEPSRICNLANYLAAGSILSGVPFGRLASPALCCNACSVTPVCLHIDQWSCCGMQIDAGADMVVTQLFYDVDTFLQFVKDCRLVGITVPIVPGIMPIMTYGGFKRMTSFCKTAIPADIRAPWRASRTTTRRSR